MPFILQYACECSMEVCGKPSSTFFGKAIADLGLSANEASVLGTTHKVKALFFLLLEFF